MLRRTCAMSSPRYEQQVLPRLPPRVRPVLGGVDHVEPGLLLARRGLEPVGDRDGEQDPPCLGGLLDGHHLALGHHLRAGDPPLGAELRLGRGARGARPWSPRRRRCRTPARPRPPRRAPGAPRRRPAGDAPTGSPAVHAVPRHGPGPGASRTRPATRPPPAMPADHGCPAPRGRQHQQPRRCALLPRSGNRCSSTRRWLTRALIQQAVGVPVTEEGSEVPHPNP